MGREESAKLNRTRRRWPRAAVLACLLLLTPHSSLLTTAAKQPVKFFEPKEHYYKAAGRGIEVRWEVPRTTAAEGADLAATLVVVGATNPQEVVKPDLAKLPAFAERFTVTDVPDPKSAADAKEVRFSYKLRPRNRSVDKVPALKFYYFNPAAAPGKTQFPYTTAHSVAIIVTEAPKAERVPVPLAAPEFLFTTTTGPSVLGGEPFVPGAWAWLAAGLFGPLAALGWYLAWRRVFPDAARLARMRRSRAARRALDAIRRSSRTPDPPAAIAAAVLGYLRSRFPLPESAATPSEIAAALAEANVPEDVREQAAEVFRACDRARFAPPGDSGASLAADAEAAVVRLEALA